MEMVDSKRGLEPRFYELSPKKYKEFVAVLEQPAKPDPRLQELFARPQRIRRETDD